ncbi:MAG: TonB-dependent receptor [Bacteroidota bacterium]
MRVVAAFLLFVLLGPAADAQPLAETDTTIEMSSVVVTATRTPKALEDVAVPTTVIPAETIQRQGAVRLSDALAAVPGLHLFDDHGTGLQVQGFAPDYTLILIDGQPVIGRTAGTLSLNRITVQGVERIELVRGPSSSLYGSEALAGVVNIITATPGKGVGGSMQVRGGSFGTSDLTANLEAGFDRGGVRLLFNRYASGGYDLTPNSFGQTVPSFDDWTADLRARARLSDRLNLSLGVRAAVQGQDGGFALLDGEGNEVRYDDNGWRGDFSIHPEANLRLSDRFGLRATLYAARYRTESESVRQSDGSLYFRGDFDQRLARAETQFNAAWNGQHLTVVGGGLTDERLVSDRYNFNGDQPVAQHAYAFAQHEWMPLRLFEASASARLDAHTDYAAQLSPKLAVLVRPAEAVRLRASVGSGFKAPDFRQLYLNFTNPVAGYSVFGSTLLEERVAELEADGQITEVFIDPSTLEAIRSESSVAYNVGATVEPARWLSASVNAYNNDITNLIETQVVARKANGQSVFGYYNVAGAYTRGLEAEMTVRPLAALGASARSSLDLAFGYQYLQARDRDVLEAIEAGTTFGRDLDGQEYRLTAGDYGGLFGRSPHSVTLQTTYAHADLGLAASLRGRWRSRYGYRDQDGNGIVNRDDEYVPGYAIVDATVTKSFPVPGGTEAEVQLGADNLFGLTRTLREGNDTSVLVPSLPGRRLYASVRFSF